MMQLSFPLATADLVWGPPPMPWPIQMSSLFAFVSVKLAGRPTCVLYGFRVPYSKNLPADFIIRPLTVNRLPLTKKPAARVEDIHGQQAFLFSYFLHHPHKSCHNCQKQDQGPAPVFNVEAGFGTAEEFLEPSPFLPEGGLGCLIHSARRRWDPGGLPSWPDRGRRTGRCPRRTPRK